ncbi:hypothetical protein [Nostoc sp. UHCC 0252]|uniref:hypothetical protein n=1 Tax=Nostoc sp. UHCC 0252 TaxID=3110241 RepID=UPI002B1FFDC0|nr:hypothetical protein [Nostoc sp. UHCC 0252]MEA5603720.1 hypothetical protein [Nostoc sp. UHCC 0252]
MTQIVGTLKDSAGNSITGKLIVVLAGTLIDDSTTPDTVYLPQSYTFTITSGALDITLPQSETSRITYNFQFFKTDGVGEIIEPALIKFDALVPNISPVQFASLVPTGLVNDVLDTGALRVARIISTTPALAQNIGGPFPQGEYNPSTTYKFRDLVTYLNRTYISKDLNPITGVTPTVTVSWMNLPIEPDGSLILADDTPYGVTWDGSGKAASQDAVWEEIQTVKGTISTKANLISPIFSGDVIVPNQTLGDASTKAANTNFVAAGLANNTTTTNAALALKAPLASPTFTGSVVVPSQTAGDNSTKAANTNYVDSAIGVVNSNLTTNYVSYPALNNQAYVARCTRTSNQTLTSSTFNKIAFNSKTEDTSSIFDLPSSAFYFTSATGGWYQVSVNAEVIFSSGSASDATLIVSLFVDNSEYIRGYRVTANNIATTTLAGSLSSLIAVANGSILDARVYVIHTSSTITLQPNARLHLVRIRT